ncbi:MAG: DUF3795 domain-containing protein [Parcubacteria group bacterium]
MREIRQDKNLVAFCGLYCGACKRYLDEKCPGCRENERASWCAVRKCCLENDRLSCADCQVYASASECRKFNNIFSKLFAFLFGSDRQACIDVIKSKGYGNYAEEMAAGKIHSIKKLKK